MDGRLSGMILSNAQNRAVEVFFDWDSGRLAGWGVEGLGSCPAEFRQRFERYDRRPALVKTAVAGPPGRIPPPSTRSFSYVRDLFGRPVSRNADAFAHDALGQVTNAVLGGASYRYAYDGIGNRTGSFDLQGARTYAANELNQYDSLTSNLSPLTSSPSYDADGNLTDDGERTFEWTASGRLLRAATDSARVTSEYDHLGRRTVRTVETRHSLWWNFADEREFVYDDWNLVHEKRLLHSTWQTVRLDYFWGPDLSGTLQGAGGVGGLVAVSVDGDYYFPGYDDNGNVIGYWDENGDLVAEYAYDAFGNTISATGPMADFFPHRFSTKYYDAETDLYYYGYRYYSPSLGRWISRDPIEEEGGMNLYAFCGNEPLSKIDLLGTRITVTPSVSPDRVVLSISATMQLVFPCGVKVDGELRDRIREAIISRWSQTVRGTKKTYELKFFSLEISAISCDDQSRWNPDAHTFEIVLANSGYDPKTKRYARSHVPYVGASTAFIFKDRSRDSECYVHEFGHMLGLPDEYITHSEWPPNSSSYIYYTTPYNDYVNHIMGDGGSNISLWEIHTIWKTTNRNLGLPNPWRKKGR